nr:hypothetical protein [Tanacetum cinerariifolium]
IGATFFLALPFCNGGAWG